MPAFASKNFIRGLPGHGASGVAGAPYQPISGKTPAQSEGSVLIGIANWAEQRSNIQPEPSFGNLGREECLTSAFEKLRERKQSRFWAVPPRDPRQPFNIFAFNVWHRTEQQPRLR